MFLSKISVSPEAVGRRTVWHTFQSNYRLHQAVWDLFADSPDRRRDFLYRVDQDGPRPRIYSLSERQPQDETGLWRLETKPFAPVLHAGDLLDFSLRANPIVTRNGKRHDVVMDAKRELQNDGVPREQWPPLATLAQERGGRWLARRAEPWGFRVDAASFRVDRHEIQEFRKPTGRKVRLATCDFQGVLEVAEPERFLATLAHGLGPAKGFGCGLMLCKRHR